MECVDRFGKLLTDGGPKYDSFRSPLLLRLLLLVQSPRGRMERPIRLTPSGRNITTVPGAIERDCERCGIEVITRKSDDLVPGLINVWI